jgi:hypothetical protein
VLERIAIWGKALVVNAFPHLRDLLGDDSETKHVLAAGGRSGCRGRGCWRW